MKDISEAPATPRSMQDGVNALLSKTRAGVRHRYKEYENGVRKSPSTAIMGAVAAGYFLHLLPIRAIVVTQARVLLALAPPVLVLFGAAKLSEFLQKQGLGDRK